jgi:TPR repeat protein
MTQLSRAAIRLLAALALSAGLQGAARAGDFEDGHAAYMHGDFETALRLWTGLAEQGHADAQYMLGLEYFNGRAVPKDDRQAAKWLRRSAAQGNTDAQYLLGLVDYDSGSASTQMGSNK